MYAMPPEYKQALLGDGTQIDVYVAVGTNIDPTSSDDITAIEGDFLPMSNVVQVTDANYQMTKWMATFEADGIKTATDEGNLAPPIVPTAYPPQVGLWSKVISDAKGNIDFSMTIRFGSKHASAFSVFSYDQSILEATVTYYLGNEVMRTANLVPGLGRVQDTEKANYDRIVLHVTRIDQPYSHVKISEVEFGTSETYGKTRLSGEVTLVQEWDPTMRSIPLFELDFSILNVLGEFDTDNPRGWYDLVKQDYPAELSFSIKGEDGSKWTVPCGRFMITSRKATDTTLDVVARDARSSLSLNRGGLTMSRSQSFGDLFTTLFKSLRIPFVVDEMLFSEYPDQDMTFEGKDYDLLTVMRFFEQYYDIWLIPERKGSIRATKTVPSDLYGLMEPSTMTTYPRSDVTKTYNTISVAYGPESDRKEYVLDLRDDPAQLRSVISILNPLVQTIEKAQGIANKVRGALYGSQVKTEWRGDPTLDITDFIDIEGKWTEGAPTRYRTLYQELTYDGGLYAETTTFR